MITARLSVFYGAVFLVVGFHMPFWPVWLHSRGMSASEIGLLLASAAWLKIVGNPMIAHIADRRGERRRPIIALAAASLAVAALYLSASGFWQILAVTAVYAVAFSAMLPLADNLVLKAAYREGLDYGRIRLWGSITFIFAALLGGRWLEGRSEDWILWLMLGGLAFTLVASYALPDISPPKSTAPRRAIGRLLTAPTFVLFLCAAGLAQASHAVLMGFGTIHWRAAGIGDGVIGLLWAEGVVAEIILFAFGVWVLKRLGPGGLLVVGAAAGIVRWSATGLTTDIGWLIGLQFLHGLTFGATHLGAMHFLARAAPQAISATAQSIYSAAALGIALGIAMPVAGYLYEIFEADAFHAMTGVSLVALVLALLLVRHWDGGEIKLDRSASDQSAKGTSGTQR